MSKNLENKFIHAIKQQNLPNSCVRQAFKSPFKQKILSSETTYERNNETSSNISQLNLSNISSLIPANVSLEDQLNDCPISIGSVVTPNKSNTDCTTPIAPRLFKKKICKFRSPFRSPVQKSLSDTGTQISLSDQIASLKIQEKILDDKIYDLEIKGYKVEDALVYIDKLHKYNEIKDAAQIVLGKLADLESISLREIHMKYGAPMND